MALGEDRNVLIEKYGLYVKSLANSVRRQFTASVEVDELISWGQLGLFEAAERFDPSVGSNFLTFAHYRIRGAIFDGLRKMGVLRGKDAREAFAQERANAYLGNLSDRESGVRNPKGSIADDVNDISSAVMGLAVVFTASLEGTEGLQIADESEPADERLHKERMAGRVKKAIAKLSEKERRLLESYYFAGKTLEEAGSEIGQSKSWASRLHARAIERLKDILDQEETPRAQSETGRTEHDSTAGRRGSAAGLPDRAAKAAGAKPAAPGKAGRVKI